MALPFSDYGRVDPDLDTAQNGNTHSERQTVECGTSQRRRCGDACRGGQPGGGGVPGACLSASCAGRPPDDAVEAGIDVDEGPCGASDAIDGSRGRNWAGQRCERDWPQNEHDCDRRPAGKTGFDLLARSQP